jgi:hypothetical protein
MSQTIPRNGSIRRRIDLKYFYILQHSSNTFGNNRRIIDLYLSALTLLGWLVFATLGSPAAAQVLEENTNRDARDAGTPASQPPTSGQEGTGAASEQITPEDFAFHAQFTNVTQYHPPFTSPFYGPNSLLPGHRGAETTDLTLFAGARVWDALEAYVNPEVDQGFGLSDTLGVAISERGSI